MLVHDGWLSSNGIPSLIYYSTKDQVKVPISPSLDQLLTGRLCRWVDHWLTIPATRTLLLKDKWQLYSISQLWQGKSSQFQQVLVTCKNPWQPCLRVIEMASPVPHLAVSQTFDSMTFNDQWIIYNYQLGVFYTNTMLVKISLPQA